MPKLEQVSAKAKARQFRMLLPAIESAIARGGRHSDIIEALREEGLVLCENTYFTYLRRYRKASRKQPTLTADVARSRATLVLSTAPPAPAGSNPTRPASERPPRFNYDPRGNPDLLK